MGLTNETIFGFGLVPIIEFALLILISFLVGRLSYLLVRRVLDVRAGKKSSKVVARLVQYAIVIVGLAIGVGYILQLDLRALVISFGLVSIAIAFASQQVLQNMIAGIMISIIRPVELEDWVEIGGAPGGLSRVTDITLMNTVLRDVDGRLVYVPNSMIIASKVMNYTRAGFVSLTVALWTDDLKDIERIRSIVYDEAYKNPYILPNVRDGSKSALPKILDVSAIKAHFGPGFDTVTLNPKVNVVDIQGTKIKLLVRVWTREMANREELLSDLLEALKRQF